MLFFGIAVLVYHFFIKLVGILLFAVEITWFVLRPIAQEAGVWRSLWPRIRHGRRVRWSALLAVLGLLLFVLPWPTRIAATGALRPVQVHTVHAPAHAQLAALLLREGARVKPGDVLLRLAVAENSSRRQALAAEVARLEWQAAAAGFTPEQRAQSAVLAQQLATARAQLAALDEDAGRFAPTAPFAGVLRDLDPDLAPGTWVHKGERLAVLVGEGPSEVVTYLDEDAVRRVAVGDGARFYADGAAGPVLLLKVSGIDRDATQALPDGRWAAQHGGSVPARERRGAWYPERAVYRVSLKVEGSPGVLAGRVWRGKVVVAGSWEAPGARVARSLAALLRQEAGF